jgi:superfamily II DNA or RNA helicase
MTKYNSEFTHNILDRTTKELLSIFEEISNFYNKMNEDDISYDKLDKEYVDKKEKEFQSIILDSFEELNKKTLLMIIDSHKKDEGKFIIKYLIPAIKDSFIDYQKKHKDLSNFETIFKKAYNDINELLINLLYDLIKKYHRLETKLIADKIDTTEPTEPIVPTEPITQVEPIVPVVPICNELREEHLSQSTKWNQWRHNQTIAINSTIKQNFSSGFHNQVMGAGKTFIIYNLIEKHREIHNQKSGVYVILCERQDILRSTIFDADGNIDKKKKDFLKENMIINLNKYYIEERIFGTSKSKQINLLEGKPTILLINCAFLKTIYEHDKKKKDEDKFFNFNNIIYTILDESHSISGNKLYETIYDMKYNYKKHIIGFSATPLREIKGAEDKLKEIFSTTLNPKDKNKTANIISTYDYMDALVDDIILPPHIMMCKMDKTLSKQIGKNNKGIILKMFKKVFEILPYKKVICWCGTIKEMIMYYDWMTNNDFFSNYKIYCSSSKDKDYETTYNTSYDSFYKSKKNTIMLCVGKYREGSDIPNVDCGVYLDAVQKRGTLVAMQTSGRIMRKDNLNKKTKAYIIDTFIQDDKKDLNTMTAEKVIEYYKKILKLSDKLEGDTTAKYDEMCKYIENTIIDEKEQTIKIKKDNRTVVELDMIFTGCDWSKLKYDIKKVVEDKMQINEEEKFKAIIKKLRTIEDFTIECDFWEVYEELDKKKYHLPENLYDEYKEFFDKSTWFELMEYDTSKYYKTIQECKNAINKLDKYHDEIITDKIYNKLRRKDNKLPPFPKEYFKRHGFTDISSHFNSKKHVSNLNFA